MCIPCIEDMRKEIDWLEKRLKFYVANRDRVREQLSARNYGCAQMLLELKPKEGDDGNS